jgi:predicted LPLAT superfamily acyltransferase
MFSTREDVDALVVLMKENPNASVLLRRGHGFFILAATVGETRALFQTRIVPYMHSEAKVASKL